MLHDDLNTADIVTVDIDRADTNRVDINNVYTSKSAIKRAFLGLMLVSRQ